MSHQIRWHWPCARTRIYCWRASSSPVRSDSALSLPCPRRICPAAFPSPRNHRRAIQSLATSKPICPDPYKYTSGRWLLGDEAQRNARYISFNFDALCRRVIELCPGATSVSNCEKKEGGFNRVFPFTTDNGQRLVARLPFTLAGPPGMTTQSEVATIRYVQAKTSIPVPKVLDWCNHASTSIGSEYIIMEHSGGVQLLQMWPKMDAVQKIGCIDAIYQKLKEIAKMEFPAYGSLYQTSMTHGFSKRVPLDQDFCIGPHCGEMFSDCNPIEPRCYQDIRPNRGPWSDLLEYCDGLIDIGIAKVPESVDPQRRPRYHGMPADHLSLLRMGRTVIKRMSEDARIRTAATPMLLHPDLNMRNIFVLENDPTVVTGVVDWQSASVEPAFWYADEVPDFAGETPDAEGQPDPDSELCGKTFSACVQFLMPKLAFPVSLDDSLFRPFRYCYRTWKDGSVAFLHELIETSKLWAKLELPGSCPFTLPTPEQLAVHQEHYRRFAAAHGLKRDLPGLLNAGSDGWVPAEDWEATLVAQKQMYAGMLGAVLADSNPDDDEPVKDERDLREIWPFDLHLLR